MRTMASHLMGGMGTARNHFDFSSMDEFADKEKRVLRESYGGYHGAFGANGMQPKWDGFEEDPVVPTRGSAEESRSILARRSEEEQEESRRAGVPEADLIGSANGSMQSNGRMIGGTTVGDAESVRVSSPPAQQQDLPTNGEGEGDAAAGPFVRRRQRKTSQSQAVSNGTRRQGRLALFEGLGGAFMGDGSARDGSFSVNMSPDDREGPLRGLTSALPTKAARVSNKNTVFGTSSGAAGQDYSKPTGYVDYPDGGRGNGGGERPYRFSFYSNALPATIHARSLSELPSDGQTFEDLFTGREAFNSSAPEHRDFGSSEAGGFKSGSTSPSPRDVNAGDLHGSAPNPKLSLLAKATAKAGGGGGSPPMKGQNDLDDPEARTWWLDVLSPTDEEMRMLAKVSALFLL